MILAAIAILLGQPAAGEIPAAGVPGETAATRFVETETRAAEAGVTGKSVTQIALKPYARVRGPWVRLVDIADMSGGDETGRRSLESVRLVHVPMPGVERVLGADEIRRRLGKSLAGETRGSRGKVEFVGANTEVRITAAIRALPGEELVTCGHKYLAEQLARPGVRVEIQDPATPAALAVPDGSVELKASTTAKKASGVVSVSVEGWVDGSRQTRTLLSYRVSSRGVVTQTTHGLESGAVISESDLEDVERDFAEVPRDAVTGRDSLIGMRVVLPVEAGSVVRRGAVALPALVKKGSPVTLVARVGKVEARTMAQARENGTHGEVITVVNLASKRMIKAKVVGEEVVEALMP